MAYLLALTLSLALVLAPLYVWRFSLAGAAANFLMVFIALMWVIFVAWLLGTKRLADFFRHFRTLDAKLAWLIGLFFLAGIISLFVGGINQAKLGQFIVLFLQPLSLFFITRYVKTVIKQSRPVFVGAVYTFLAAAGILAIIQYLTLFTLPPGWWGNSEEPKRAIGFFVHPNGFSLFITPLLAWVIPDSFSRAGNLVKKVNWLLIAAWFLGVVGLLLSLSRGAWLGFVVALGLALIIKGGRNVRRTAIVGAVIAAIVVVSTPHLRYRLVLPFYGEKSTVARFSLWNTGWQMVKDSPIVGQGLHGFNYQWDEFNQDPNLDHYNFAHNIVLNFWTDTGLLGVISFTGLVVYGWYLAWKNRTDIYKFGLGLFLVVIVLHGLIDIPYLKNDLALVFWLIWGWSE